MKRKTRGFAIPLALCIACVGLALGMGSAQLSAGDLQMARHAYLQARAQEAADYGLERCFAQAIGGVDDFGQAPAAAAPLRKYRYKMFWGSGPNDFDVVQVAVYDNRYRQLDVAAPLDVPAGSQLLTARADVGGSSASLATLVRPGRYAGSAGAQVRYLTSPDDPGSTLAGGGTPPVPNGITYLAASGLDGSIQPGQFLCSTDSSSRSALGSKPLDMKLIDTISGQIQMPPGATKNDVVDWDPSSRATPSAQDTGGASSAPSYVPPSNLPTFGNAEVDESGYLVPGYYSKLTLNSNNLSLQLNGTYHFGSLSLAGGGSQVELRVGAASQAHVYLDQAPTGVTLALANEQQQARKLKLELPPLADTTSTTTDLQLKLVSSTGSGTGAVSLVAPGHRVEVGASSDNIVAGAFLCDTLKLGFISKHDRQFVYDVTADPAQRNAPAAHVNTRNPQPTDPGDGNTGGGGSTTSNGPGRQMGADWPNGRPSTGEPPSGDGVAHGGGMTNYLLRSTTNGSSTNPDLGLDPLVLVSRDASGTGNGTSGSAQADNSSDSTEGDPNGGRGGTGTGDGSGTTSGNWTDPGVNPTLNPGDDPTVSDKPKFSATHFQPLLLKLPLRSASR